MTSKGKIMLERKEEMKMRGPYYLDRADAVTLAFAFATEKEILWTTERPAGW
jgi:hypothetical protein